MRRPNIIPISVLSLLPFTLSFAEEPAAPVEQVQITPVAESAPLPVVEKVVEKAISPFTGKVKGNKVRMRCSAAMDSKVVSELKRNELVTIVGEKGNFWSVKPPAGTKAYVFRTFVLDGVVEGNHVNVRLEPKLDAAVIGHLNAGEKIEQTLCTSNSKWYEIAPPDSVHFYIAKEYIDNVGGPEYKAQIDKRRAAVEQILDSTALFSKTELGKRFSEMSIDRLVKSYQSVIENYADLPEYVEQAKQALSSLQETYTQKRIAYLESKTGSKFDEDQVENEALAAEVPGNIEGILSDRMQLWEPVEEALFLTWARLNEERNMDEYYGEQKLAAVTLNGIVEAYATAVKNKPGDFVLKERDLPVAYLYSTKVDLHDLVGKKVTLLATPRSNNNFAYPAYFVIDAQK